MSGLALFDARPKCDACGRHYDSPTWEVVTTVGVLLDVCSECAHDFPKKRQRVSAR